MEEFKIDITSEIERFKSHIDLIGNNQIIFSGIFGIGKTFFLTEFFEENNDNYELFLLSPINYSISNNDDIIDYIKYDIAFELLGKNLDYENTDYSLLLTSQFYLEDNFLDTVSLLAKSGGKIGKAFSGIYENLKKIADNIKQHNSESQTNEKKELIDFLKDINAKENSIYEENRITELISGLIEKLKENKKEIVLVIDDLDRLDPEHIFRILNVFACHFDFGNSSENKFGFDKIVLVCDIENIRNIFLSKYGANVDFSGYIDKFYSREIHYFNNKEIVKKSVTEILSSIKIEDEYNHIINLKDKRGTASIIFQEILEDLINSDLLNLRTLLKLYNKEYKLKFFEFKINETNGMSSNWHFQKLLIFDFLISFYGSITSWKTVLDKLTKLNPSKRINYHQLKNYKDLIAFIDYNNHKTAVGNFKYENPDLNLSISYKSQRYGDNHDEITATINKCSYFNKPEIDRFDFPFAPLLKLAFDEYLNLQPIQSKNSSPNPR